MWTETQLAILQCINPRSIPMRLLGELPELCQKPRLLWSSLHYWPYSKKEHRDVGTWTRLAFLQCVNPVYPNAVPWRTGHTPELRNCPRLLQSSLRYWPQSKKEHRDENDVAKPEPH